MMKRHIGLNWMCTVKSNKHATNINYVKLTLVLIVVMRNGFIQRILSIKKGPGVETGAGRALLEFIISIVT